MNNHTVSQRLDEIDANLNELRLAVQALVHAQLSQRDHAGTDGIAVKSWIAGEIRDMARAGEAEQDVAGYAMTSDPHDSVYWCYSRYVCPTVLCGSESGFWC